MKIFTFEKSVGAVLFREESGGRKYLLLHYPGGHWDFAKGHIEKGESHPQTLKREVAEETGIVELEILPNFSTQIYYCYRAKAEEKIKRLAKNKSLNVFKKVVYYLAKTETSEIAISDEHTGYEWLTYEKALETFTHGNSRKVLIKAQKYLENQK
jgi:8-oxo-dGTP pyrophosphatase MutT (NUDIX family)